MMEINFLAADKTNFRANRQEKIKYLVVHYTAGDGDTAKNNAKYFAQGEKGSSAHYFVDEKEVWQSVRDIDVAWHCGAKKYYHLECRNENSIGIELCSYRDNNGYHIAEETQARAIELIIGLMKKYDIDIDHVLRHYDVTHKNCPAPFLDDGVWREFKQRLTLAPPEIKKITMSVNGREMLIDTINIEGVNFIRLRDLPKLFPQVTVSYDVLKKQPVITEINQS